MSGSTRWNSLATTVSTPAKWPGRAAPSSPSAIAPGWTRTSGSAGYIAWAPAGALGARADTHLTQSFDQLHRRLLELHHGAVGQVGVAEPGHFPHTPAGYGEQPRGERLAQLGGKGRYIGDQCRELIRRHVTGKRHDIESGAADAGIQEQVAHGESVFPWAL